MTSPITDCCCISSTFRYDLKLTSPEIDLLWSKLPSEKDDSVSFTDLVQYCFLNFNVASQEGDEGQPGAYTVKVLTVTMTP